MKEKNVRVLVTDPSYGVSERTVPNTLEAFQQLVDGYIEVVAAEPGGWVFVVDEEGKLKGKPPCIEFPGVWPRDDILVGTVVAVGVDEDEFRSLTDDEIAELRKYVKANSITEVGT